jgi:PAS domain S-box-containing protein
MEGEASRSLSILIVDDDERGQQALRPPLQAEGYRIIGARFDKKGLETCKRQRPDLAILSISETDTNQISAFARLREIPKSNYFPILVAMAAKPDAIKQAFLAGADEYIRVPVEPVELRQRVRQLLRWRFQEQHKAERERAEKAERRHSDELEVLWQASLKLTSSLELNRVLRETVNYTIKLIEATNVHIFMYDGEQLTFGAGLQKDQFLEKPIVEARPHGVTYSVARSGHRIVVPNISTDPQFKDDRWKGSVAGLPLKFDERVIGVIVIAFNGHLHEFDENELRALELLADQAAIALQNVQYVQQIEAEIAERKRAEEAERDQRILAEALRDAAAELSGTLDAEEVMGRILLHVARVVPHDAANIMLIDSGYARVRHVRGSYHENVKTVRFDVNAVPNLRHVFQTGKPFIIDDAHTYAGWQHMEEVSWIRANLIAPIKVGGSVIGFLSLDSARPHTFTDEHARRLTAFATQAGVAIENARLYQAIQNHAIDMEQRVAERTMELERERAQLQALLDAMGEGVTGIVTEGDTTIRFTNKALMELIGLHTDEWDGDLFKCADISEAEYADFRTQVAEHIAEHGIWRGEFRLCRKDNGSIDVSVTSTAVKGTWGQPIGSVTIVRDISDQKNLQRQQQHFIANASHELRTPLTNMGTRLYLMRRQPDRLLEHFTVMDMVVERMRSLVENMLDLSRFERGMISLSQEPLVLQTLVRDVIRVQEPEAELKNIVLTVVAEDEPLEVMGDANRLTQVITNVITNAINYTPQGGHIDVSVSIDTQDETLAVVRIQDTGIGIAPELLPHIFKPFFRATEHAAGTGLGLSIAHEIVELHNGEISVDSQVNVGSTFHIRIPRLD